MKFLVIADKISPSLYDYFDRTQFNDIDLVISCGDLPADYMDFVVTMLNIPCYYVPGNHDAKFAKKPPAGWRTLDDQIINFEGVSIAGFGGSKRYKSGPFQYSETQMTKRFQKLKYKLWWQQNKIDILVTHAPAYQLGDLESIPHQGFKIFKKIIDTYKPKYHLHGHVHLNYSRHPRVIKYKETQVINGYQHYIFDY